MSSNSHVQVDSQASAPFEGPEKLLEIWFAPSVVHVAQRGGSGKKVGLRAVQRQIWDDMLEIVKCRVLSFVEGVEMDAYLLSESSFFVFPHRLILKTCGTTLNLLSLPRILEVAANEANLHTVYRFFYSRKAFMFPERQHGPHKDWKHEVEYLDHFFQHGAAYTIGKVNGDHWLLYMASSENDPTASPVIGRVDDRPPDYTIEILMSDLSPRASEPFFVQAGVDPSAQGIDMSKKLGITDIFSPSVTNLDAYAFTPCGYSSNALIKWHVDDPLDYNSGARVDHAHRNGFINRHVNDNTNEHANDPNNAHVIGLADENDDGHFNGHVVYENGDCPVPLAQSGEGYYTIHVTPEQGWSYASFECNVPLATSSTASAGTDIPDLKTLIKRVVNIFEPGRITLTLFMSSEQNDIECESSIEAAQRAFKAALMTTDKGLHKAYKRTDKINYEFGSYDLAFASFELK